MTEGLGVLLVLGLGSDSWELHHGDADTVGGLAEAEASGEPPAMTTRIVTNNALSILRLLPLLVLVLPAVPLAKSQDEATRSKDSLATLTWKTGWIPLGEATADLKKWAVGADPNAEFTTGVYEIVGSNWNRREPRLPKVGARIRLVTSVPVEILDYATAGEKRRLEAPSSASRPLGPDDQTGIRLSAGTLLEVRSVKVSRPHGHIRVIWARVVPVSH
jgi:hypothetical protein